MAKNLIATFVEGMEQLGYSKKDMIKFIEIQYNNIERIE
jgi:DNA-binding transcriptional regulator YhcF (GntR family)